MSQQVEETGKLRRRPHIHRPSFTTEIDLKKHRSAFWLYCVRSELRTRYKCKKEGLTFDIDANVLDEMFVNQQWRCSISNISFTPPGGRGHKFDRDPFLPSIDRIIPERGYTKKNIRLVCLVLNLAINEWGLETMQKLFDAIIMYQEVRSDRGLPRIF